MVRILFDEPQDVDWIKWQKKCQLETDKFIKAVVAGNGDKYVVSNLYKDSTIKRKYYFNDDFHGPFWRKCAYCEESVGSQDGDVEHFRPKKSVANQDSQPIPDHPGYYWLAYNWQNLLPSCSKCNRLKIWEKVEGKFRVGKQDRFPLEDDLTRIYSHTEDILRERPLLINPLLEEPELHLAVETKTGIMKWQTNRGRACIDMFGLNVRDDLREGRKSTIRAVKSLVTELLTYLENEDKSNICLVTEEIMRYVRGEKRFSLAARCYLRVVFEDNFENKLTNFLANNRE